MRFSLTSQVLRNLAAGRTFILAFHDILTAPDDLRPDAITTARFDMLLDWVEEHFRVVDLEDALRHPSLGARPQACLTFDDGYPSWVSIVMPRLARRGLPATFFVSTGSLHSGRHWHQRAVGIIRAMSQRPHAPVDVPDDFPTLELASSKSRQRTVEAIETWFKQMPPSLRDETLTRLEKIHPVEQGVDHALDWDGLQSLASAGFGIGAHSCRHPILSRISIEESRREIFDCRDELQQRLGHPIAGFAYPNGRPGIDFDARHVDIVRQAGYSFAVTTARGSIQAQDDRFMLRRFTPWGSTPAACSRQTLASLFYGR